MDTRRYRCALAVGCSGMLRGALAALAADSELVWSVSRRARGKNVAASIVQIALDWRRPAALSELRAQVDLERVEAAMLWIHESGRDFAAGLLAELIRRPCRIVQVVGSIEGDPVAAGSRADRGANRHPGCEVLIVSLGAMPERSGWRWLTDEEISTGAITALQSGRDQQVGVRRADLI